MPNWHTENGQRINDPPFSFWIHVEWCDADNETGQKEGWREYGCEELLGDDEDDERTIVDFAPLPKERTP
jgi:hypothetical protein